MLTQGSYRSWKTGKVKDLSISRPGKVTDVCVKTGKARRIGKQSLTGLCSLNSLFAPLHKVFHTEVVGGVTYSTVDHLKRKIW